MTELTGRQVAAMFVGGFGIIIAVNITLATNAVRTFPGLETANSYVASQSFDARRAAQEALGWQVEATYADGTLHVAILDRTGAPAPIESVAAHIGRPTEARDDLDLDPTAGAIPLDLAPGIWRLDLSGQAPDGTLFEKDVEFRVAQ